MNPPKPFCVNEIFGFFDGGLVLSQYKDFYKPENAIFKDKKN
jgi:hypothetical protein